MRTRLRFLVLVSALLVALALAAGLRPGEDWLVWLLIPTAMGQGMLAGATWRHFWRGPPSEAVFGAGGRFGGFVAAVAFSAVEAHAVGASLAGGAPGVAVAVMLVPPLVIAAIALRSALAHRPAGGGRPGEGGRRESADRRDAGRTADSRADRSTEGAP